MNVTDWIGFRDKEMRVSYDASDIALYNLAIGAHKNDVRYFYPLDSNFQTIPTYALVAAFMCDPETGKGSCPSLRVQDSFDASGLDWDQDLYLLKRIDPNGGEILWQTVVENIYDRGPNKGVVISNRQEITNAQREPVAISYVRTVMFSQGGFGGEPVPKNPVVIPEREPDYVVNDFINDDVHILYAHVMHCITAKPIHIDPAYAKRVANFPDTLIQGHLTLGFACRIGLDLVTPDQAYLLKHIGAQFRNPLFPNTNIRFQGWRMDDSSMYFRVLNTDDNDKIVLNNGILEWENTEDSAEFVYAQ